MAAPLSQQLERLLNPLPILADPEDEHDPATIARVIDKFDEENDSDDDAVVLGSLRKRASAYLADTDKRYLGKATSRKALREESGDQPFSEDSDEESLDEDLEVPSGKAKPKSSEEDNTGDEEEEEENDDDDEEEEEVEGDDDDDTEGEVDDEEGRDGQESLEGSEQSMTETNENDDDGSMLTFSKEKVTEEVEKGQAVKNQMALWDQLLEGRIKLQKVLLTANQLPQTNIFLDFKKQGGPEMSSALKNRI